jgi:hypothetical protein
MYFQKVLKGINGINQVQARQIVDEGLMSNWWRKMGTITAKGIKEQLNETNAMLHLNSYNQPLPVGHPFYGREKTFGDVTPFISTTAGAIQRDVLKKQNFLKDPFMTALKFATRNFRGTGFIFHAYLITLGKKAIELEQFSEDVRELHIYQDYLPYQLQGEVMAKILIPSVQIEMALEFDGPAVKDDLRLGITPSPVSTIKNPSYLDPQKFSNIKEILK